MDFLLLCSINFTFVAENLNENCVCLLYYCVAVAECRGKVARYISSLHVYLLFLSDLKATHFALCFQVALDLLKSFSF